jgi:hypothetical protein
MEPVAVLQRLALIVSNGGGIVPTAVCDSLAPQVLQFLVCVKLFPTNTVFAFGDHADQLCAAVPVADCDALLPQTLQLLDCVNDTPVHLVDVAGVHVDQLWPALSLPIF